MADTDKSEDIRIDIKVDLDVEQAEKDLKDIKEKTREAFDVEWGPTNADLTADALDEGREHQKEADKATDLIHKITGFRENIPEESDDSESGEKGRKTRMYMQLASSAISHILAILKGFTSASLNLIMSIYEKMKAASPLLQAVESLFQLAMTLFFMPLGNKIAEVMLPAVLKLLDGVMGIWNMFAGANSLGEIFEIAFRTGIDILGEFFKDIGNKFKDQGNILGKIGNSIHTIGEILQNSGYEILDLMLEIASWVLEHIKGIIASIVALTSLHYSLMLALVSATVASSIPWLGSALGYTAATVAIAGPAAAFGLYGDMSGWESPIKMAKGGYVPAAEGGSLRILGEGGEGEYVIPESKMGMMGGTITNNFYIEGVTSEELGRMIDERVNSQISLSKIRSGF